MRELVKYNEFLNEQLFGRKRRREEQRQEEERIRRDAQIQARRAEADRKYREDLEKARRERPQIEKFIDILENHRDLIKKTKYQEGKNEWGIKFYNYGLLTNDEDVIVVKYHIGYYRGEALGTFPELKINGEIMSNVKEKKANQEIDPLGEESWEENEITPYEKLCELVKKYVLKNEIVF